MRIIDYIQQGGPIMYILLFLNIVGLATMFYKFLSLRNARSTTEEISDNLGRRIREENQGREASILVEISQKELSNKMGEMEKGLNTVKIIASISPLLGLLGTVLGVLVAFKVMSQTGLSDPSSFAGGISMALLTTVGGLVVAIPHYIGHSYLIGLLDQIESDLEKKLITKVL